MVVESAVVKKSHSFFILTAESEYRVTVCECCDWLVVEAAAFPVVLLEMASVNSSGSLHLR